jgi:uncharacterized protein YlbG (UPF0298 family)
MKRLYRVYYTVYDDDLHAKVLHELRKYGEVVDHPSRVLREFRFVEVLIDQEGLENEIKELVANIIGTKNVKVDWIDTSK